MPLINVTIYQGRGEEGAVRWEQQSRQVISVEYGWERGLGSGRGVVDARIGEYLQTPLGFIPISEHVYRFGEGLDPQPPLFLDNIETDLSQLPYPACYVGERIPPDTGLLRSAETFSDLLYSAHQPEDQA